MMARAPRVTVLLPVYNGERHLRESIASVLEQTFTDFELLVISDGSTDSSVALAGSYTDPRVRIVAREQNLGLVATLNEGLALARGEYIARQDADDVLRPERLATQVRYLDTHQDVAAVGSCVQLLSERGDVVGTWQYPQHPVATEWALLFNSALAHSSATFRAARVREVGGYSGRLPHVEDYELWSRLILSDGVTSVPEVLQGYRLSEQGVSRRQEARQMSGRLCVARENMTRLLGHEVGDEALEAVIGIDTLSNRQAASAGLALIGNLWTAFRKRHGLRPEASLGVRELYFQSVLGVLARVPAPARQALMVEAREHLPLHPTFVARLAKLLLRVWS